jgi:hypothetical protein
MGAAPSERKIFNLRELFSGIVRRMLKVKLLMHKELLAI